MVPVSDRDAGSPTGERADPSTNDRLDASTHERADPSADDRAGSSTEADARRPTDRRHRRRVRTLLQSGDRNGQLVLVAAAVVAVALLPIVIAYGQLGYAGVATTEPTATTPEAGAVDALERTAFAVATDEQGRTRWANRSAVGSSVAQAFDEQAAAVETSEVEGGRVHEVAGNASAARNWAGANCPSGPARQFGDCVAVGHVALQERAGDAHVLAIAVDVETVTDESRYRGTYVLDAELGDGRP